MRYEPPVEIEHPEEAAELLECFEHGKVFNLTDFRWGRADALIMNDVPQEFYLRYAGSKFFSKQQNRSVLNNCHFRA